MKETSGLRNQLRAIRSRLGISQQDLAAAAGVARQTIGGIEAQLYSPSAVVGLRLAKALGCRVEEIFWLEEADASVTAAVAGQDGIKGGLRVALARINARWMAYPLEGDQAFRTEMAPADGVAIDSSETGETHFRLLDDTDVLARTVVLAGCTPVLSLWARSAERWHPGLRVHWAHANSMAALASLACGEVHAAGLHLYEPATGQYNAPFVRKALGGRTAVLVNLGVWEEGLLVQPGNPKGLRQPGDLAGPGIRIMNRDVGAGSRLLLESALTADGVDPASVAGWEDAVCSHQEAAACVARGEADASVSTAAIASIYGLSFVPIRKVRYDLALNEATLREEAVQQLLSTLQHRWVRSQFEVLGGFDTAETGQVTVVSS